jgi:hypothetical protein
MVAFFMLPGYTLDERQYRYSVCLSLFLIATSLMCIQSIGSELNARIYDNEPTTERNKQEIESLVAERETVLQRVMADMTTLRQIEARTRAEIVDLRGLLSPIRRLPPEILLMIFRLVVGPNENEQEYEPWKRTVESNTFDRAFTLSHVCLLWRNTAIGMPRFWSRQQIHIKQARGAGLGLDEQTALVSGFLNRALPHLIDLDILIDDLCPIGVLKFLQPFVRYIRLLRLHGAQQRLFVLSGISEKGTAFSALEVMEVFSSFEGWQPEMMHQLEFSPPRLRSLTLHGFSPEEFFTIDWAQLTEFYVFATNMDPDPWRKILLQCCANLTSCTLAVDSWDEVIEPPDISIQTFPSMRDFDVHFAARSFTDAIFQPLFASLSFPSLRSFRMVGDEISAWNAEDIFPFAARSFATLQTLYLSWIPMEAQDVWMILGHTPNLVDLTLQGVGFDEDEFFPPLIPSMSSPRPPLVPRLEGLTIEDSGYLMDDNGRKERRDELLEMFVAERWWTEEAESDGISRFTSRLKEVSVVFEADCAVSEHAHSRFEVYRSQGLKITL